MAVSSYENQNLVVPVKAATVFAAQESSMFLGGSLIPLVNTPTGHLKVPKLAKGTAASLIDNTGLTVDGDIAAQEAGDTSTPIICDLIAARSVVRDLGSVDANEIGRMLGSAVATAFDKKVYAALDGATSGGTGNLSADVIIDQVASIRGEGEMGQLFAVVSPAQAAIIMKELTASGSYAAGGDFQTQVLRSGFLGTIAGVQMFVSSNVTAGTNAYFFGADAARIAMQRNVDVESARRAEAVGNDIVASLHAGVGLVDAARARVITAI